MTEIITTYQFADTPSGSSGAGPADPGSSYSFEVELGEGNHLSFATMCVQSNDLFYSPGPQGLSAEMGSGAMTGTGADAMASVTPISEVDDGFSYPSVSEAIRVTIEQM